MADQALLLFESWFALVSLGVGYLGFERHRLRQDFESAALGVTLGVTGILAIAHVFTWADHCGASGTNPGVAPYFFFGSYLTAFIGGGLAASHARIRALRRGRRDGMHGGDARAAGGFLVLAVVVWLIGLLGCLVSSSSAGIAWYVAGLARPVGAGIIFVGLLREPIRLYRDARARVHELETAVARLEETQAHAMRTDKLRALGTLLSGVTHELNNPLSTIQLSVQLLKRHELPEAVRRRVEAMDEECERVSRIIRDLLVFARRKPPERRELDLTELISRLLTLQAPQFEVDRIQVVNELRPVPRILGDPRQLQQVFLNLFANASHAMKSAHGRGTLTVRSWRRGTETGVEVDDDGPGIPAGDIDRIFDPFFTTKTAGEGTGLGLSLAIGIVEAHGGRMTAENLPGAGARFTVRLPIADVEDGARAPETPAAPRRARRVLIVEDEARLRETVAEVLAMQGHEVEQAGTGAEALARIEQTAFDLVTLDLRLPDMDGRVLWQRLRSQDPQLAGRVVFMTGDTTSAEIQTFLKDTGRPILAKPLTVDRVREVIDKLLAEPPTA